MPKPDTRARDKACTLLDKLLGANRNGDNSEWDKITMYDQKVCKNFLQGLCPHELFQNTKIDLGPCPLEHREKLVMDYKLAVEKGKTFPEWEEDLLRTLLRLIDECDKRISRAMRRVENDQRLDMLPAIGNTEAAEIAAKITELVVKAETLGEEGNVDESMEVLQEVEELKRKQEQLNSAVARPPQGVTAGQKLRACDICGAYLSLTDSDRRLADHFGGKQHVGYMLIRERVKELQENQRQRHDRGERSGSYGSSSATPAGALPPSSSRRRSRSPDRHSRPPRSRSPSSRHHHRDHHRHSHASDRDRRDRDRDRDRESHRSSRDRESHHRSGGSSSRRSSSRHGGGSSTSDSRDTHRSDRRDDRERRSSRR